MISIIDDILKHKPTNCSELLPGDLFSHVEDDYIYLVLHTIRNSGYDHHIVSHEGSFYYTPSVSFEKINFYGHEEVSEEAVTKGIEWYNRTQYYD